MSFFHESFFYYAFARCFVSGNHGFVDWLVEGRQSFFRRGQVSAILAFSRRNSEKAEYLASLEGLLDSDGVRFHIKQRALRWLRETPDPMPEEWTVLELVEPSIGSHIWDVPWNSVAWFDTVCDMRRWDAWLSGDDGKINLAIKLLQSPKVLSDRAETVIDLIDRHRKNSVEWWDRAWNVALAGCRSSSPELNDWILRLIWNEPLQNLHAVSHRGRWVSLGSHAHAR